MSNPASLGTPLEPLPLSKLLAKAASLRKCVAYRIPSVRGKPDSSDLFYMTTEDSYQKFKKEIDSEPQLHNFGGKNNQYLRLVTAKQKNTYNRLGKRKDLWMKLEGPVQVEAQLVSPIGELPGHISWDELEAKAISYKPADQILEPQTTAAPLRQSFIDEVRRKPMPKSRRPVGVVWDEDDSSSDGTQELAAVTPYMPVPEPKDPPPRIPETPKPTDKTTSIFFHPKSPLFAISQKQSLDPPIGTPARGATDPAWLRKRNRSPSPTNGETRTVNVDVIQPASQRAPTPIQEVVTMEDAPEEKEEEEEEVIQPATQREPTPIQRIDPRDDAIEETEVIAEVTTPPSTTVPEPQIREPVTRCATMDEIIMAPLDRPDPRAEPMVPAINSLMDPDISLLGSLLAEYDNLGSTIMRHTNLVHDNRFPVLPGVKAFQVPSMKRVATEDLVIDLNRIYEEAAAQASRALIRAEVDAAKLVRAELASLADSRLWTEEDIEAAQMIRLSRKDRLKPYKPSNKPPVVFFELSDGAVRPHASAAGAHTTAGRFSDSAPAEPKEKNPGGHRTALPTAQKSARTPEQRAERNRKRRESRKRKQLREAAADRSRTDRSTKRDRPNTTRPATAGPTAAPTAAPRPQDATAAIRPTGNGQLPRQTGNRGNNQINQHQKQRQSVFARLGHRPEPENRRDKRHQKPRPSVFTRLGDRSDPANQGDEQYRSNNERIAAIHIYRNQCREERMEYCRLNGIKIQLSANEKLLEACRKERTERNGSSRGRVPGGNGRQGPAHSRRNY